MELIESYCQRQKNIEMLKQDVLVMLEKTYDLKELPDAEDYAKRTDYDELGEDSSFQVSVVFDIAWLCFCESIEHIVDLHLTNDEVFEFRNWLQERTISLKVRGVTESDTVGFNIDLNSYLDDFFIVFKTSVHVDEEIGRILFHSPMPAGERKKVLRSIVNVEVSNEQKVLLERFIREKNPRDEEYYRALDLLLHGCSDAVLIQTFSENAKKRLERVLQTRLNSTGDDKIYNALLYFYHEHLLKRFAGMEEVDGYQQEFGGVPLFDKALMLSPKTKDWVTRQRALLYLLDMYQSRRQRMVFEALEASIDRKIIVVGNSKYELIFSRDYADLAISMGENAFQIVMPQEECETEKPTKRKVVEVPFSVKLPKVKGHSGKFVGAFRQNGWCILVKEAGSTNFSPGVYMFGDVNEDGDLYIETFNFLRLGQKGIGGVIFTLIGNAMRSCAFSPVRVRINIDEVNSYVLIMRYILQNCILDFAERKGIEDTMSAAEELLRITDVNEYIKKYILLKALFQENVLPFAEAANIPSEILQDMLVGKLLRKMGARNYEFGMHESGQFAQIRCVINRKEDVVSEVSSSS